MRTLAAFCFVIALAAHAEAQGLAHVGGGLAGVSGFFADRADSFHIGGGGEVVVDDRLGFGVEIGLFDRSVIGAGNVTVHLGKLSASKVSPFISGGYSYFGLGDGSFSAFHAGAGLHYWAADRVGLRVEFRDHFRPDDRGTVQYWSIRAGVAFR